MTICAFPGLLMSSIHACLIFFINFAQRKYIPPKLPRPLDSSAGTSKLSVRHRFMNTLTHTALDLLTGRAGHGVLASSSSLLLGLLIILGLLLLSGLLLSA
jgi:hypothetical protein